LERHTSSGLGTDDGFNKGFVARCGKKMGGPVRKGRKRMKEGISRRGGYICGRKTPGKKRVKVTSTVEKKENQK